MVGPNLVRHSRVLALLLVLLFSSNSNAQEDVEIWTSSRVSIQIATSSIILLEGELPPNVETAGITMFVIQQKVLEGTSEKLDLRKAYEDLLPSSGKRLIGECDEYLIKDRVKQWYWLGVEKAQQDKERILSLSPCVEMGPGKFVMSRFAADSSGGGSSDLDALFRLLEHTLKAHH